MVCIDSCRDRDRRPGIQVSLDRWGDQVHFLYSSSWAIVIALMLQSLIVKPGELPAFYVRPVALWSFFAALVHDLRLLLMDFEAYSRGWAARGVME